MQYPFITSVLIVPQVHKVRFVASTLLDAVRKAETAPASAARAHAYLCEDNPMLRVSANLPYVRGLPKHFIRNRKKLFVRCPAFSHST